MHGALGYEGWSIKTHAGLALSTHSIQASMVPIASVTPQTPNEHEPNTVGHGVHRCDVSNRADGHPAGRPVDGAGAPVPLHTGLGCVHRRWDSGAPQAFQTLENNDPLAQK